MDITDLTTDHRAKPEPETVEIPGVGTVAVRGLSRLEFLRAQKIDDPIKQERFLLSVAMTDPVMTEDDVAAWQRSSDPMEINVVAMKINELSGIAQGADKRSVDQVRD